MSALDRINHIVVLMLENRSFDNMLGMLYPKSAGFDGLDGTETNLDANSNPVRVWNRPGTDETTMTIPNPDPGELWADINTQLFGTAMPAPAARMAGFVRNYTSQAAQPAAAYKPGSVMHYFTPEQVPVISRLARQFAVCDRWHASAPCQTWPNRFFVHTGTANGYENNSPPHFPYEMPTIFNRFEDLGIANGWKIYFHDVPQSLTLAKLWPHLSGFRLYEEFQYDARTGNLPAYSFIEPRYFADVSLPNDQHPPHVVTLGEQLIADVYNRLRNGPAWAETLLVIIYDEHGGCYDHVPPPKAKPPSSAPSSPFNFDRYGVRVPAVIVSPFISQGTVLRPPGDTPFDHTSIIATLRKRFSLGAPLSDREMVAPDLETVLSLSNPDNVGPEHIEPLPFVASPADVAQAQAVPLNNMQESLLRLAAILPQENGEADFASFIAGHVANLQADGAAAKLAAGDLNQDVGSAVTIIKKSLGNFFRTL
ncbi:MAG: alkaline phosphatase family protein [Alphaproteobacteria bacterium]